MARSSIRGGGGGGWDPRAARPSETGPVVGHVLDVPAADDSSTEGSGASEDEETSSEDEEARTATTTTWEDIVGWQRGRGGSSSATAAAGEAARVAAAAAASAEGPAAAAAGGGGSGSLRSRYGSGDVVVQVDGWGGGVGGVSEPQGVVEQGPQRRPSAVAAGSRARDRGRRRGAPSAAAAAAADDDYASISDTAGRGLHWSTFQLCLNGGQCGSLVPPHTR